MAVNKENFCFHFWGKRSQKIPAKTKEERYQDYIESNVSLGRYIVLNHRLRPGMLVKIKPFHSTHWYSDDPPRDYVAIFMEALTKPTAGDRWFVVFHDGELKQVLDYEVHEVLIESL